MQSKTCDPAVSRPGYIRRLIGSFFKAPALTNAKDRLPPAFAHLVPPTRFERATFPLGGGRSIQLSYEGEARILAWNAAPREPAPVPALLESSLF